jgi:hypothetical protein
VFNKCTITGAGTATTDLGRPWQPYASVAYINSSLSGVIKLTGWNDWGNTANDATARFGEYNNTGAGSSMTGRPSWVKRITATEAASYTVLNVLKGTYASPQVIDNWNPQTVIDQTNGTAAATLTKHGAGSSSQTVTLGTALTSFYYTWANATSVTVSGLPSGVTSVLNTTAQTITISGTPTATGTFAFKVTTTGGSTNVSAGGTITVNSAAVSSTLKSTEANSMAVSSGADNPITKVYPNPLTEASNVILELVKESLVSVKIFNLQGEEVRNFPTRKYAIGAQHLKINPEGLSKGIYLCKVTVNGQTQTIKIVVGD